MINPTFKNTIFMGFSYFNDLCERGQETDLKRYTRIPDLRGALENFAGKGQPQVFVMFNLPLGAGSSVKQKSFSEGKTAEDASTNKPIQKFVTRVYEAKVANIRRNVTITWSKNLMNHTLDISIENPYSDQNNYSCKVDLKTWQLWGKKGLKSLKVDEIRVDVFWDFRSAKFSTSPEPCSDYYVAIVSDKEVVLLLGDQQKKAFKRTKSRPCLVDALLVHKKECVFAKKCFCTKTTVDLGKRERDVIIETSLSGPYDPEMWISVDGIMLIRITNLHWRFRGNETVSVDGVQVQIFWDVHSWLYNCSNSVPGVFIFKPITEECEYENNQEGGIMSFDSLQSQTSPKEYCHLLLACKIE